MDATIICVFFTAWRCGNGFASSVKTKQQELYSVTNLLAAIDKAKQEMMREMQEDGCEGEIIRLVSWTACTHRDTDCKTFFGTD